MSFKRDYFICHATPDKDVYARPLVKALEAAGMSCWLDEAEVLAGDSLTGAIDRGLESSQYVVAILTPRSVGRQWSEYEIRNTLARQIHEGTTRLVPVLADFTGEELEDLLRRFPVLRDRLRLSWDAGISNLTSSLDRRLQRQYALKWEHYHDASYAGPVWFQVLSQTPASLVRVHARWGRWHWAWDGEPPGGRGPVSFTHLKAEDGGAAVKLLIQTDQPAQVRFGVGPAPAGVSQETGSWWEGKDCDQCLD